MRGWRRIGRRPRPKAAPVAPTTARYFQGAPDTSVPLGYLGRPEGFPQAPRNRRFWRRHHPETVDLAGKFWLISRRNVTFTQQRGDIAEFRANSPKKAANAAVFALLRCSLPSGNPRLMHVLSRTGRSQPGSESEPYVRKSDAQFVSAASRSNRKGAGSMKKVVLSVVAALALSAAAAFAADMPVKAMKAPAAAPCAVGYRLRHRVRLRLRSARHVAVGPQRRCPGLLRIDFTATSG